MLVVLADVGALVLDGASFPDPAGAVDDVAVDLAVGVEQLAVIVLERFSGVAAEEFFER